jgi:salicylate hydroxylase
VDHWGRGRVTLVGDAAHPMTNFWGQGANIALEDAVVLARCLDDATEIAAAFARYEELRIPRTTRIVDASFSAQRDAEGRHWKEFVDWLYGYDPEGTERR